jgi:hypothetical protein
MLVTHFLLGPYSAGQRDFLMSIPALAAALASAKVAEDHEDSSQSRAGLDSRLDLDVPVAPFELQDPAVSQLLALMRDLGLSFSAVDLKMTADGELYFLELNPQGQFLYIEILTGQPIAAAMARLLVAAQ